MIGKILRLATARPVAGDQSSIELMVFCNKGWYFGCIVLLAVSLPINPLTIAPLPLRLLQNSAGSSRSRPADESAATKSEQGYNTYLCGYRSSIVCRLFALPLASLFDRTP